MSKIKRSVGNMYDWLSHVWSPIVGCPHQCSYCFVRTYRELPVDPMLDFPFPNLGRGRSIFVGHLCDMFAKTVPSEMIERVLEHCRKFDNEYIFQTKNPGKIVTHRFEMPARYIIGTTIETNDQAILSKISKAPPAAERAQQLAKIRAKRFVTIEPILDFNPVELTTLIVLAMPDFVNIGADSKGHGLPEPSGDKIRRLVELLNDCGIKILRKTNLERLMR
jgi:DNA repair photolyase